MAEDIISPEIETTCQQTRLFQILNDIARSQRRNSQNLAILFELVCFVNKLLIGKWYEKSFRGQRSKLNSSRETIDRNLEIKKI